MAELTADLFISLDGFAAADNTGPYFDYAGPDLEAWIRREVSRPQIMVMGRVTYETMAAITATATDELSTGTNEMPKIVVSRTLTEPLTWQNTRVLSGDLAAEVSALKRESDVGLRTIGSLTLVRSLVALGLVDRLRLLVFPLLVGPDGREPAFAGHLRSGLDLIGTEILDSSLVLLEYRPSSANSPGPEPGS
jgi:dihydrofolate reductase